MQCRTIPFKTSAVAQQIGVTYFQLYQLLRMKRIPEPQRDGSGDFVWFPEDIEAARNVLTSRVAAVTS